MQARWHRRRSRTRLYPLDERGQRSRVRRDHGRPGTLRSFAYAITSARDEGDPQNTEKGQIRTPGRPTDTNVKAAAVGIDWL